MRQKTGRHVAGILLLDKWLNATSNQALQRIKRLWQAKKAGHTGSLDPLATGMLPICFGQATKFCQFLLDADKSYDVTLRLGQRTTTGDAEGEIMAEKPVPTFDTAQWEDTLQAFRGKIMQVPSMYSALKHQGKPLYEYARQGIEIPREPREVHIHQLLLKHHDAQSAAMRVTCSKGTYIRNLVEDIGEAMGCGAHVTQLRRTHVAPYTHQPMYTLEDLEARLADGGLAALDACLLPIQSVVAWMPKVTITSAMRYYLSRGEAVQLPELTQAKGQCVALYDHQQAFWGVGEALAPGRLGVKRLLDKAEPATQSTAAATAMVD